MCWEFGGQDVSGSAMKELLKGGLKSMLWSVTWRRVKDGWPKELSEKPKLAMLKMMFVSGMAGVKLCTYMRSAVFSLRALP